ncbi:priA domain protein [Burkholderia pseudomallei NAU35A-3]|nr:priA domain protein [Burkholderia pseudomallei NAU35A-3]
MRQERRFRFRKRRARLRVRASRMARDANARAAGTRAAAAPRARVRDEDWRSRHASVSDRAAAYVRIAYTYVANSRVCDAYVPDVANARAARTRHGLTRGSGTRTRRAHAVASHAAHAPATHIPSSTHRRRPSLFAPPAIPDRHDARLPRARQPHRLRPPAFRRRVGAGTGAFVALCRASESESDIWPFDPQPDPLLHRPASSTARAKYTRETIRAARAAGNPCARRCETAAPGWTNPAGREAPGGKARGRGHIAAGTSARATPRAAPVTRLGRGTRCSRPPARSVTLAPTLIPASALAPARHTPSVAARRAARSPRRAVDCERASAARIASRHALSHRVDASQRAGPSVIRSYFHARAMRAAAPAGIGYTGRL